MDLTLVSVSYSDIEDGVTTFSNFLNVADFNIVGDPLFDANLILGTGSPCINTGNTAAIPADVFDLDLDSDVSEAVPFDYAGNQRVNGSFVDMGAIETL